MMFRSIQIAMMTWWCGDSNDSNDLMVLRPHPILLIIIIKINVNNISNLSLTLIKTNCHDGVVFQMSPMIPMTWWLDAAVIQMIQITWWCCQPQGNGASGWLGVFDLVCMVLPLCHILGAFFELWMWLEVFSVLAILGGPTLTNWGPITTAHPPT